MAERQQVQGSRLARWRERRRAGRQDALERQRFEHERASSAGGAVSPADDLTTASAYAGAHPVDASAPVGGSWRDPRSRGGA